MDDAQSAERRRKELEQILSDVEASIPEADQALMRREVSLNPRGGFGDPVTTIGSGTVRKAGGSPPVSEGEPVEVGEKEDLVGGVAQDALLKKGSAIETRQQDDIKSQEITAGQFRELRSVVKDSDPDREALYDEVCRHLRSKRRRREVGGARRLSVGVTDEVFSAVSYLAFSRDLDKVEVLSYLLGRYVPGAGVETIPGWLSRPSEEPSKKSCFLSFFEDEDLKSSLNWIEMKFGVIRVDIVEAVVERYLPKAPFAVLPRRRMSPARGVRP